MFSNDIWYIVVDYMESEDVVNLLKTCKEINQQFNYIWNYLSIRDLNIKDKVYRRDEYETYKFLSKNLNCDAHKIYDICNKLCIHNVRFISVEAMKRITELNKCELKQSNNQIITTYTLYDVCMMKSDEIIDSVLYEDFEDLMDRRVRDYILYSRAYYVYVGDNIKLMKINYNVERWYYCYITWFNTLRIKNKNVDNINRRLDENLINILNYSI